MLVLNLMKDKVMIDPVSKTDNLLSSQSNRAKLVVLTEANQNKGLSGLYEDTESFISKEIALKLLKKLRPKIKKEDFSATRI